MADNLKNRGKPDTKTHQHERGLGAQLLEEEIPRLRPALAGAVRAVGKSAAKVEKYLKEK